MKIIAVFMIVCLTFLSSLLGIANAMQPIKDNCCYCCYNNNQSKSCRHQNSTSNDCNNSRCNVMLSCNNCGFITEEPLTLSASITNYKEIRKSLYNSGDITDYINSCWRPPKG